MRKVAPMLATLIDEPFDSKGWLFEKKWDGYRALAYKNKTVQLLSRGHKSFNKAYPSIVQAVSKLPGSFVVDGEIVLFDAKGRSSFQLLQNYLRSKQGKPYYCLFDILSFEGKDLTHLPLIERKKFLKKLLSSKRLPQLLYSDDVREKGKVFFRQATKKGWEGIIAKKEDSTYQFRRSRDWLKIKTVLGQEVVIGGFTEPKGARKNFGALLVGVYEKGRFVYVGHVGGGFNTQLLGEVHKKLKKLVISRCPFAEEPHPNTPVTWVSPKLVCEVEFREWTNDGIMRQPIFKGLRIDKSAKKVVRERGVSTH